MCGGTSSGQVDGVGACADDTPPEWRHMAIQNGRQIYLQKILKLIILHYHMIEVGMIPGVGTVLAPLIIRAPPVHWSIAGYQHLDKNVTQSV